MADEEFYQFNLNPVEFSRYFAYFHRITPRGEKLSGGRAREFFLQTRLSPPSLSTIWKLADIDRDGCLSSAEFPLAMYLTQQNLRGIPLPLYLPNQLHSVYVQVVSPQLPVATDSHLAKCKKAFEAFRQNIGKGVLGGDAARYLLSKSNLSKGQLYHIWKLSDLDEDGHLTFKEFTVAMHLLFIAKLGYYLPVDLDPNTILPPSYHDIIRLVQAETERLPTVDPNHIPIQPFSPPATPSRLAPSPFGENPFSSDEFVSLPATRFREGEFEKFSGDPFESIEIITEPPTHSTAIGGDAYSEGTLQQFKVNTGSVESISQDSQASQTHSHSSGVENEDPEPIEQHDYYTLEDPSQTVAADQAHSSAELIQNDTELSSRDLANLSQTSSVLESESEKSSPSSRRSEQRSGKSKSSVESLQDVVVTESEEPMLQQAKPVDVIGSREVTPIPEDIAREGDMRWVSPGQVQAELEELSRASRKFLQESRNRLAEQQRRNFADDVGPIPSLGSGMDELRAASRKGLSATIQEMEGGKITSREPAAERPVINTPTKELQSELEGVQVKGDMISHLDNLEAEIWAVLEETENLHILSDPVANKGGAMPVVGSTRAGEKMEVKKLADPPSSKKVKVTSVQINVRKSSRGEDPRKVQSQLVEPVKQVTQAPKSETLTSTSKNQPPAISVQDQQSVVLRRPRAREPVVSVVNVKKKETRPAVSRHVQPEKTTRAAAAVAEKEPRRSSASEEEKMVDIDSFLEGELASINEVLEQFQTDDQKAKQRNLTEEKLLESKNATDGVPLPEVSAEEISRRRQIESQNMEEQWEAEMKRLEEERLQALQKEEEMKKMIEDDEVVQTLDKELQSLIEHEEQAVKETQKEKELRLQREQEEQERKEREKREKRARQLENQEELTVEEWISWMEEKKKQGMTPEQQAEYEKRKKAHLEKEKEREMKRKKEIEEQKRKTREMMLAEQQAFSERDSEVKSQRLTDEELKRIQEEHAKKEAALSELRKERSKKMIEDMKQRELEEATPKARSALAARWEEQVRSRSGGGKLTTSQNKATVMSDSLEREKQRMARIIASGSQNGDESS